MTTARSFNAATDKVVSAAFAPSASKTHLLFFKSPSVGDTTSRGLFSHGFSPYVSFNASEFGGGTPTAGSIYWSHSFGSADRRVQIINPGLVYTNWNHAAFRFDSTTGAVSIRLNGVTKTLDLDVASSGSIDLNAAYKVTVGNRDSGAASCLASIAFFEEHNVVLTDAQCDAHMTTGLQALNRTLAWNLGAGSPEPDQSGNGRSGTVTGTTVVTGPTVSTGISQAISPAAEASSAISLGRRKARALGIVVEADAAQLLGRRRTRALGPASEADSVQGLGRRKTRPLGAAAETDAAQPAPRRLTSAAINPAAEVDQAQPIGRRRSRSLSAAIETDAAQRIGLRRGRSIAPAAESDVAQPIGRRKVKATSWAAESDAAQPIARAAPPPTLATIIIGRYP